MTCAHVLTGFAAQDAVEVRFAYPDDFGQQFCWVTQFGALCMFSRGFSSEHSYDYMILDIPGAATNRHNFEFSSAEPAIGESAMILGYPFEHNNLTLHQGFISSLFEDGVAKMIQVDMSVNASNSGGPLVRPQDGLVYAVVARKATGLTDAFKGLLDSLRANVDALEAARTGSMVLLNGIDPLEMFTIAQVQMEMAAREIRRSANVGIGYCVKADVLQAEAALQS